MNDDLEPGGPLADPAVGTGSPRAAEGTPDAARTPDAAAASDANPLLHIDVEPAPPPRLDAPMADREPRPTRTGGRGLAGILGASLLSAILASTGTAAALTGSLAGAATASPTANTRAVTTAAGTEDITAVVAAARH